MPSRAETLYEEDFYAWTRQQARELRRLRATRPNAELDLDHLALEIRDLGNEQLFAVQSQAERLIEHLLKLAHSRHEEPRRQWLITVNGARRELNRRLSRALRRKLAASLPEIHRGARADTVLALEDFGEAEAAAPLPLDCPYSLDQLLDPDWLPERAAR